MARSRSPLLRVAVLAGALLVLVLVLPRGQEEATSPQAPPAPPEVTEAVQVAARAVPVLGQGSPAPSAPVPEPVALPAAAPAAPAAQPTVATAPVPKPVQETQDSHPASPPAAEEPDRFTGSMRPDDIRAVIRSVSPAVRDCYHQALKQDPTLGGKITVEFEIEARDGKGKVVSGEVPDSEMLSPFFEACVLQQVAQATFPAPEGGPVKVRYPFRFDTGVGFGGGN